MRALLGWLHPEPLLAVVLWGGIYPGAKLGLREIPVLSFTSLRLLVASAVLVAVAGRIPTHALSRDLLGPVLDAAAAQTVFQLLLVAGVRRTTAGNSAILLAPAPLITAGWLALTRRQPLEARPLGGLLLGILGVGLVVRHAGGTDLGGDAIALAAAGAWAWYGIAIGPVVDRLGARWATGLTMLIATAVITPLALPELTTLAWRAISWPAWAGLIYGATLGMVVAMTLWGRSVSRLGPRETMVYVYVEPVSAVVIAAVLLGESLSAVQALGAAVTFAAVWIASTRGPSAPDRRAT